MGEDGHGLVCGEVEGLVRGEGQRQGDDETGTDVGVVREVCGVGGAGG